LKSEKDGLKETVIILRAQSAQLQKDKDELKEIFQKEIDRLRQETDRLRQETATLREEKGKFEGAKIQIGELNQTTEKLQKEIDRLRQETTTLREETATLREEKGKFDGKLEYLLKEKEDFNKMQREAVRTQCLLDLENDRLKSEIERLKRELEQSRQNVVPLVTQPPPTLSTTQQQPQLVASITPTEPQATQPPKTRLVIHRPQTQQPHQSTERIAAASSIQQHPPRKQYNKHGTEKK